MPQFAAVCCVFDAPAMPCVSLIGEAMAMSWCMPEMEKCENGLVVEGIQHLAGNCCGFCGLHWLGCRARYEQTSSITFTVSFSNVCGTKTHSIVSFLPALQGVLIANS